MPLEQYRKKRDFARTPEPAGVPQPTTAEGGRFVVQRHRATRLHYDFRLEIGGVLVSWAVPKGPSLDPDVKRMAMHVEDHPIEYLDFEGVIPRGEYGAGDVIVWDWGTWRPEEPGRDPEREIADGELKFHLDGEKLRGRYTIVRTRPLDDGSGEPWLLIKKRDDTAVAGWDVEAHPQSVKTGRTNDEVKANRDAVWISNAPAGQAEVDLSAAVEAPMPDFIEPMNATLASHPFDSPAWLFEVKWDGYRVEAVVRDRTVRIFTRRGNDAATYFPGLLSRPTWIAAETAIVDGEVVALDPDGVPHFELLQRRISGDPEVADAPLIYMAFDLLYLDGRLLTKVPTEDRKRLLRSVLRDGGPVRYASHIEGEGRAFFEAAKKQGLEGIMAKERRSRYEPGRRVTTWLKLKVRPEQELVVGGYIPGAGSAKDLGALLVGVYEDGRLAYGGRVGSGLTGRTRSELKRRLDALARPTPPFDPPPPRTGELRHAVFAEPEIVIRAEFADWTREGTIRQSAFKGIVEGRDTRTITRERAVEPPAVRAAPSGDGGEEDAPAAGKRARTKGSSAKHSGGRSPNAAGGDGPPGGHGRPKGTEKPAAATEEELAALARLGREGLWQVGGRELKLTNLDKVLFPPRSGTKEEAITKRELIAYFGQIGPALLPHLRDRPLNLNRFPNGAGGPSFWQKDLPATAPSWLPRWKETWDGTHDGHQVGPEHRKPNMHLLADEVATLCWLGNQASFEIHAWTSLLDAPDSPTYALIDIDPGDKTTWDETLALARLFRTALGHLHVTAFPKVTGKRGVQIWIPIVARYTFGETSAWVEGVSRAVGAMVPDIVSWEWSVADRKGRARLDYTQNASIKTLVAPYAVRPLAGAPVSAPIAWDELDDPELRSDRWTIRSILPRIAERGDLFAGALTSAQELPSLA